MNENNIVTIMDVDFLNTTKKDFLREQLFPRLKREQKCFVVTANPEIVMKAREDVSYKKAVQSADYVIPDGVGILMAAKYKKQPLLERIPGYELMLEMLEFAEDKGFSCYFLGATEYVNEKAVSEINEKHPNLTIAGNHHGFFDIDDPAIAEEVRKTNPDIVFVALGLPRQEKWIATYMGEFSKGLFIGVGGTFDGIAGEVKRAPQGWINLNLEWLYRLLKQPFRWKRILKVFEFMVLIVLRKG